MNRRRELKAADDVKAEKKRKEPYWQLLLWPRRVGCVCRDLRGHTNR